MFFVLKIMSVFTETRISTPLEVRPGELVADFLEFVQIPSPTGYEQPMSDHVRNRLKNMGLTVVQDKVGNVYTRLEGTAGEPLLFAAHLDTVQKPGQLIYPYLEDGVIRAKDSPILAADNKSTVAAIFSTIRWLQGLSTHQRRPIEVLFTVREESDNLGAKVFDREINITAKEGLTADYPAPVGTIVLSAPGYGTYDGTITGRAAHAARPEEAIDVTDGFAETLLELPRGRIAPDTTANRGLYRGGLGRNTVPGTAFIDGEIRSGNNDTISDLLLRVDETFQKVARRHGLTAEVKPSVDNLAYSYSQDLPFISKIWGTFLDLGISPSFIQGQYCSDVNVFYPEKGLQVINIGSGEKKTHTPQESIEIAEMVLLMEVFKAFSITA